MLTQLEQELLRAVPAWEEQQGVPFMIDGARLVDTLREQLAAKENRVRHVVEGPDTAITCTCRRGQSARARRRACAIGAQADAHSQCSDSRAVRARCARPAHARGAARRGGAAAHARRLALTPGAVCRDAAAHRCGCTSARPPADAELDACIVAPRSPYSCLVGVYPVA